MLHIRLGAVVLMRVTQFELTMRPHECKHKSNERIPNENVFNQNPTKTRRIMQTTEINFTLTLLPIWNKERTVRDSSVTSDNPYVNCTSIKTFAMQSSEEKKRDAHRLKSCLMLRKRNSCKDFKSTHE